jgi:hypothetical protein
MDGLTLDRAALHALLTDAHVALAEHRIDFAGAVLHALRRITAPPLAPMVVRDPFPEILAAAAEPPPRGHKPELAAAREIPGVKGSLPAEPQARARSSTPNTGRAGGVWTPERDEALARGWHDGLVARDVLPLLNALPAPAPVASEQAVYARANTLRLKRPREVAARLLARAGRLGAERAAQMAAEGVTTLGAKPLVWTQPRLDLGRQMWEAGESAHDMLPALNALPATVPVSSVQTIRTQAAKQRWQRPEAFIAAQRAGYADRMRRLRTKHAEPIQAELEPSPAAAQPPEPAPYRPPVVRAGEDQKAEVFDAFTAGQTVRAVAEDFDLPLSVVSTWQAEWKRGVAA